MDRLDQALSGRIDDLGNYAFKFFITFRSQFILPHSFTHIHINSTRWYICTRREMTRVKRGSYFTFLRIYGER